jgi:glycosyltransferase involved in cell wall biosynthesis
MTLVSLIMPVWKPNPEWLFQAVTSALDEQSCNIELLVIDDGCEEPVDLMLRAVQDERLRVIRVEHGGAYAARNAGIRAAKGTHVRFVDSDDIVESTSTGRLLELAGGREDVLAYGATLMCDEEEMPFRTATSTLEGDAVDECLLGGFDVYVVSMLFPRAVIERVGDWEETAFRVSGDWDFVLRAVEQASVRPLRDVVTRYRRHRDSMTGAADVAAGAEAGRLVLQRYFERHPERRHSSVARRAYARLHLDRAWAHAGRGEHAKAGRELTRAARVAPRAALGALLRWLLDQVTASDATPARH